jgi:O-antigen ligase
MIGTRVRPRLVPAVLLLGLSGLLAVAAVAGALAGADRLPIAVIVTPLAALAAVLSIRRMEFGLCLLPLVAAAMPFTIGSGTQSPIVAALPFAGILVGLGLLRAIRAHDWSPGAFVTLPTVALMVTWIIAYLWSNVELEPLIVPWPTFWMAQLGGTGVLIISAGVLLLAISVGRSGRWIELATWTFIGCGTIALVGYFLGIDKLLPWPFETGGLFTMWVVALSLGQALFNERLPWPLRIGLAVYALLWQFKAAVLQTWWFSGWIPPLVVLVVITWLRSMPLFAGMAVVAGVISAVKFDDIVSTIWGMTLDKGDLKRLDIWGQSLDLFSRHPVLGTGPAGYAVHFWNLYMGSDAAMSTHNNYMDVLLQTGVVGTLVFAWFLLALVVAGWQARSAWRSGFNGGFAHGAFAGLIGMLVAMAQGDWFIPFVYNQTIAGFRYTVHSWVFLGFLVSLALIRQRQFHGRSPTTTY